MSTRARGVLSERDERVSRFAKVLMEAWAKAEPKHGVTLHPVSYVATFADMARAVIAETERECAEEDVVVYMRDASWGGDEVSRSKPRYHRDHPKHAGVAKCNCNVLLIQNMPCSSRDPDVVPLLCKKCFPTRRVRRT